jgi:glycogen phosphorylase
MKAIALNQSKPPSTGSHAMIRTGPGADVIAEALIDNLHCLQAKLPLNATRNDWYMALAYTVRDRMLDRYLQTLNAIIAAKTSVKVVAYLSVEFLTGPHLGNSLINLGGPSSSARMEERNESIERKVLRG